MPKHRALTLIIVAILFLTYLQPGSAKPNPRVEGPEPEAAVGGSTWIKQVIDATGLLNGKNPAIAFDPATNTPFISYYREDTLDLWLAWRPGTGAGNCGPENRWICEEIDTEGQVGLSSSVAARTIGNTHYVAISYFDAGNNSLKLFKRACVANECTDTIQTIEISGGAFNIGEYSSVKINSLGKIGIAYTLDSSFTTIMYASQVTAEGGCLGTSNMDWLCAQVDWSAGFKSGVSQDYDLNDVPHIAYYDVDNGDLILAWKDSSIPCHGNPDWSCVLVEGNTEDVGRDPVLYARKDSEDKHRIAYYHAETEAVRYAEYQPEGNGLCDNAYFNCYDVDYMGSWSHTSSIDMVLVNLIPYLAFSAQAGMGSALKLAHPTIPYEGNCGNDSSWWCSALDERIGTAATGLNPAIAADGRGRLYIAYQTTGYTPEEGTWLSLAFQGYKAFLPGIIR